MEYLRNAKYVMWDRRNWVGKVISVVILPVIAVSAVIDLTCKALSWVEQATWR